MDRKHEYLRTIKKWGTFGKYGQYTEPQFILIKDITNNHLLKIINHVREQRINNSGYFNHEVLDFLLYEKEYREKNNINVIDIEDFKFLKK